MKIKSIISALALGALFAAPAYAAPLEMNFQSTWNPAQRQNADALEPWAKSFEEKSGGDMIMHLFYTGGLVDASALPDAIKSGIVDAGGWTMTDYKKQPYLYLAGLPYIMKDQAHSYRVNNRFYNEVPEYKKDVDSIGVFLSGSASAPFMIASRDTPIHSPADIKGKRVLSTFQLFGEYIEAWGGIPVTIAPGDVYVGLQRGMGEMFLCGISCVKGSRVHEFCKYATDLGMASSGLFPYSINRELFEKDMTDEQRKLTMELSKDLGKKVLDSFLADVQNAYAEMEAAGCKIIKLNDDEMAQFAKAAQDKIFPSFERRAKEAGVPNPREFMQKYIDIANSTD